MTIPSWLCCLFYGCSEVSSYTLGGSFTRCFDRRGHPHFAARERQARAPPSSSRNHAEVVALRFASRNAVIIALNCRRLAAGERALRCPFPFMLVIACCTHSQVRSPFGVV